MNEDEIKDIAPQLTQFKRHNKGFNLPHDYFETIEEKVFTEIKLGSYKNEIPFKVPTDYFDSVESNVHAIMETQHKKNLFTLTRYWIPFSVAAMLVLTIGIVKFSSKTALQTTQVEVKDMEEWLENGSMDMNSYEIASIYETELSQINPIDFLNEKEIEDYLQNDINQLYYE